MRRRAARIVTWTAALLAAGVVGYGICEQRTLRAEWHFRGLWALCGDMPLEMEAFREWDTVHGERCWAHFTALLDLGGTALLFRRMATGDRLDVISAAFAVSSIDYNLAFRREELNRLRELYGAGIAARAAALFDPTSPEAALVRNALEPSRVIDIKRSR